jgi:hypothetical protein
MRKVPAAYDSGLHFFNFVVCNRQIFVCTATALPGHPSSRHLDLSDAVEAA